MDDQYFEDVFSGATCKVETFGFFNEGSDLRAENVQLVSAGISGSGISCAGQMEFDVEIDTPGTFSVYNSLTAISVCRHFEVPAELIKDALKKGKGKGKN